MNPKIFEFDLNEKINKTNLFNFEYDYIIGTDEAGRGPGAGPVYASAVCFKNYDGLYKILSDLDDSKKLSEKKRLELFPLIKENAIYSIKKADVETIEKINILNASLYTMKLAIEDIIKQLNSSNVLILIDGNKKIKDLKYNQKTIIKGDSKSAAIAAASILSKVSRDNFMYELDKKYPDYNFKKNKGYLTKEHIEALKSRGITKEHRKSFLKNILK